MSGSNRTGHQVSEAGGVRPPRQGGGRGQLVMVTVLTVAVVMAGVYSLTGGVLPAAPAVGTAAADSPPTGSPPAGSPPTSSPGGVPPGEAVTWNPGQTTYQVDNSGCHIVQKASLQAATPEIAEALAAAFDQDKLKLWQPSDPAVGLVQVQNVQRDGTRVDLEGHGWLKYKACGGGSSSAVPASLASSRGGGGSAGARVLGTVDLTDANQVRLAAESEWFPDAVKALLGVVAFIAVSTLAVAVVVTTALTGGTALNVFVTAAVAGCLGGAIGQLILAHVFYPDKAKTVRQRISVATQGCLTGSAVQVAMRPQVGRGLDAGVRRQLSSTEEIIGPNAMDAANQAGVDVTHLASMVAGVADGGRASS